MFRYIMIHALSQEISKSLPCLVENLTRHLWELAYGSSHDASLTYRVVLMQKCAFHISPWIKLTAQGEKPLLFPFLKCEGEEAHLGRLGGDIVKLVEFAHLDELVHMSIGILRW